MNIPVNLKSYVPPIREKYFDETELFGRWFIFGVDPADGTVDIASSAGLDPFEGVPKDKAERIVMLRLQFCSDLIAIINS